MSILHKLWAKVSFPKKIAMYFFLLGAGWLVLTDYLLVWLFAGSGLLSIFESIKDWLFIAFGSILIYVLFGPVWEELTRNQHLLRIAGKYAKLGGWSVDLPGFDVHWSDETAIIHEMPPGTSPSVDEAINYYAPEYRDRILSVFQACLKEGIPYEEELQVVTAKGNKVWVRTIGEAVWNEAGEIVRVQGSFQDISKRKDLEQELLRLATYDQLTGLLRPHAFHELLDHAVSLAEGTDKKLVVIFIDLDKLKNVNDQYGHRVGDEYIRQFALRLKAGLRTSDIVARLGGDEFGACLENISSIEQVSEILGRLESSLVEKITINDHGFRLNYSLGYSVYPDDENKAQALLTRADEMMYAAKNSGNADKE